MIARRLTRRSFGAGLVDEHDARVEIALLAGQALVDLVRHDVRDAAPVVRRGEILLAGELLAGDHVPQPELDLEPAVALARDAAGDQRLRVDRAPVGKARQRVEARDLLDVGRRIDRREQAGAAQVGGDDLRDAARGFGVARRAADEIRDRDRHRLHVALRDVEPQSARRAGDASSALAEAAAPSASTRRRVKPNGEPSRSSWRHVFPS